MIAMRKTDARIRYTQGVLKQALLSFLKEKPINKITVCELVDECGMNRNSFYYHFDDIYGLFK